MTRRLDTEEQELWRRVARTARRLHAQHLRPSPSPQPVAPAGPQPDPAAAKPGSALSDPPAKGARIPRASGPGRGAARVTLDLMPDPSQALADQPLRMDARRHLQMRRGKLDPESRIDLHGMTLAEAHPALTGFVLAARARGLRLVLVITGKGRGEGPRPLGALRREVPHWLRSGALAPAVLEVREAHARHGGSGALYVYLRRHPDRAGTQT